ncbi:MAG: hypothetical protein ACRDVE_01445, partial [Actinocrinis sp.]
MTSKNSGISAPAASGQSTHAPDGVSPEPEMTGGQIDAANENYLRGYLDGVRDFPRIAAGIRDTAEPEAGHQAQHAASSPCPPWCTAQHEAGDTEHYSGITRVGPVGLSLS